MEKLPVMVGPLIRLGALAILVAGCTPPMVEGSLGELVDLHYQDARITFGQPLDFTLPIDQRLLSVREVAVQYTVPQGSGENVIFQVTADVRGLILDPGTVIDLAQLRNGAQRGTVNRNVLGEPGHTFPLLARGQFILGAVPSEGRPVHGTWAVTFIDGTDFACGRTAFQEFSATLDQ